MRILYIDHHASTPGNGGDTRAFMLAREWKKYGDDPTVLVADHSHRRSRNPELSEDMTEKKVENIRFCYLLTPSYEHGVGGVSQNRRTFLRKLYTLAPLLAKRYRPQVVIAASGNPYEYFCARRIAKFSGAKLILEFREAWPQLQRELYSEAESRSAMAVADFAMNCALRGSDLVVSLLPGGERYCREHGISPRVYCYLPPSAPSLPQPLPLRAEDEQAITAFHREYPFLIVYAGELTARRQLELLAETAGGLARTGVGLVIAGNGGYKLILRRMIMENGYRNILLLNSQGERRNTALLQMADCLYYGDARMTSGKYGDYSPELLRLMRFGKPLLTAVHGCLDAAQQCFCALNAADFTVEKMRVQLTRLAAMRPAQLWQMGENARVEAEEHRSRGREAAQYREEIQKLWE